MSGLASIASDVAAMRRRFAQVVERASADWDDEVARRVRSEHCDQLERGVAELARELDQVDREIDRAFSLLG